LTLVNQVQERRDERPVSCSGEGIRSIDRSFTVKGEYISCFTGRRVSSISQRKGRRHETARPKKGRGSGIVRPRGSLE